MTEPEQAVKLLLQARNFENQTVRSHHEMGVWRRELDLFLKNRLGDNWRDRYNTPERVAARKFIDNLFRGPR